MPPSILAILRQWTRNPAFTAVAVITLALGIGANTAIFSVIHGILIRPFPYPESDRIMFIAGGLRQETGATFPLSMPELEDFKGDSTAFSALGGAMDGQFTVTGIEQPTQVKGGFVSPETLVLLGVPPMAGRLLQAADDRPGADPVCVLSDRAWSRFFQRTPDVIGKPLLLNGRAFTVVGLMPPDFKFWDAYVYVPLTHGIPAELRHSRSVRTGVWGIGRTAPGVTAEAASTQLSVILKRASQGTAGLPDDALVRVTPLSQSVGNRIRSTLYLLFGAVGCVLLIACVNVTNLLLARGAARQREFAVRTALGAGRRVLLTQLLWEGVPLAVLSAVIGILLAHGVLRALVALIPVEFIPAEATLRINAPVLAFSALIALGSALLSSILPAFQISQNRVHDSLRESSRGTAGTRGTRVRSGLIIAEVALALALLVGAGLLLRDLGHIASTDPGFRAQNLAIARIDLPEARYPTASRTLAFREELLARLQRIPAFSHVAIVRGAPLVNSGFSMPLLVEGRPYTRRENLESGIYNATTGPAIEALGLRVIRGRFFDSTDREGSERVAVINEAAVKRFFPDSDPLGKRVASGIPASLVQGNDVPEIMTRYEFARIVGIVSDARQFDLSLGPQAEVFYPFEQAIQHPILQNSFALVARTRSDARALLGTLRQEIQAVDRDLPVDSIQTMESVVRDTLRGQRFVVTLLGAFAGVALVLSTLGIYSVVAWVVGQRTREMGIRLALGSPPGRVVQLVVSQGLRPVLIGLGLGIIVAMAGSRILVGYLTMVGTFDPATYLWVAGLLLLTAAGACWIPARRAARVDPMLALRTD